MDPELLHLQVQPRTRIKFLDQLLCYFTLVFLRNENLEVGRTLSSWVHRLQLTSLCDASGRPPLPNLSALTQGRPAVLGSWLGMQFLLLLW